MLMTLFIFGLLLAVGYLTCILTDLNHERMSSTEIFLFTLTLVYLIWSLWAIGPQIDIETAPVKVEESNKKVQEK